ncbi:MAG: tyrosine-type recombinase/integrase [Acidobacteriota bacterium]
MHLQEAVNQFLAGYFSTHARSPRTIAAYSSDLDQFAAHVEPVRPLHSIGPVDAESWASDLKSLGLAPASIRRKLAVLKVFFNYWVRRGELERSPLWLVRFDIGKVKPLTRTLTVREMSSLLHQARARAEPIPQRLLPEIDKRFLALRNWAIVELLFATGIRVGEATSILLGDLILDQRTILIRGKGGRQRLALLTEKTSYRAITAYHRQRVAQSASTEALFLNRRRNPLSTQGVAGMLSALCRETGITRRVTPHMLRHTAATFLLHNGADLRIVQEFLGHASITTTQRYTHVSPSHLKAALLRFHPRTGLCAWKKSEANP